MIPKKIHYCWFGRGPMSELNEKCLDSWHKYMPDYEYCLWNEDNFDVNMTPYTKEAYEAKKYAFVSDYVRLYALYQEGGIYMDTDVEILRPLDDLLTLTAFAGYEGSKHIPLGTGILATQSGGEWVKEQLDYYVFRHFIMSDGTFDMTTNPVFISQKMREHGFVFDGKYKIYKDLHVFPVDYFCPRQTTGEMLLTDNTYCNHHFCASWSDGNRKYRFLRFLGQKNITKLIKLKRRIFG